jgi:hypothetical protein
MACRRGWEWWPSIAWQFAWSWLYAPYLLIKVRKIDDTHGWRLQTIVCCLAGYGLFLLFVLLLMKPQTSSFSYVVSCTVHPRHEANNHNIRGAAVVSILPT